MWRSFKELFSCIQIWPILFNSNVHILRIKNCICWNMSLFYKLKKKDCTEVLPFFFLLSPSYVSTHLCFSSANVLLSPFNGSPKSSTEMPLLKLPPSQNIWTFRMTSLFLWSVPSIKNPSLFIYFGLKKTSVWK